MGLEKAIGKNVEDASTLDTFSLERFENIAYVMAKHADANIPDDDTQVVTIIRVMYGGRDVDTQLNRFTKTK